MNHGKYVFQQQPGKNRTLPELGTWNSPRPVNIQGFEAQPGGRQQLWLAEHLNVGSENKKEREVLEPPFTTEPPLGFPNKALAEGR